MALSHAVVTIWTRRESTVADPAVPTRCALQQRCATGDLTEVAFERLLGDRRLTRVREGDERKR